MLRMKFNCLQAIYSSAALKLGYYAQAWKTAEVVFIPKRGKNPNDSGAHRPISLLPCLGKGLERLVARRVGAFAEDLGIFPAS